MPWTSSKRLIYIQFMSCVQGDRVVPVQRLTLSWRRSLLYRNQSIDLQNKSMDWFLYHTDLCHVKVNDKTTRSL